MPSNKDLKRLVRARMRKTGEAYTAARAQIVKKPRHRSPNGAPAARSAGAASGEFASLAGMSDAAVKEHTGCTWDRWVRALDIRLRDCLHALLERFQRGHRFPFPSTQESSAAW